MLDYFWLAVAVGGLYAAPVYAAWATWPDRRWRAAWIAAGWTTTWFLAVLWIAMR